MASFRPDVIYLWNLLGLGVVGIVSLLNHLDLPWVWHLMDRIPAAMCELPTKGLDTLFEESSTRSLSKGTFIVVSHILLQECRDAGIDLGARIFVLPTWVLARDNPSARVARSHAPLRCLNAGSMSEHKGTGLIVEAASRLIQAGRTDFLVDLYGPGDLEIYRSMAERGRAGGHVRFHGSVDRKQLDQLYLDHDVFLFPTWYREPNAFVVFEAAAAGCVPIMSTICGNAEWLVDNVHVIKIERSAEALVEALVSIMNGTTDLEGLRRRGSWAVRTELQLNKLLPTIERILQANTGRFAYSARQWQKAKVIYNLLDKLAVQMVCS
jgi:glycosyltransferase involved in cell wall biosynthesis